jgi:hypothetical protein
LGTDLVILWVHLTESHFLSVFSPDGSVWNQVFMGVTGAPDGSSYPSPPFTTFSQSPVSREKPFLFKRNGEYFVRVPSFRQNTVGVTWALGQTTGTTIPLSDFYAATPVDTVAEINQQLAGGKHLLFTPGVYDIDQTIAVENANTVVLGLGLATLTAVNGAVPLRLADEPGIIVSGITIDAGAILSPTLFQVGPPGSSGGDPNNPTTLHDVYFRVGGPHIGKATVCLEVNSNHVLVDHTWVWRADHGIEDFNMTDGFSGDNERWRTNVGKNGVVINGNYVTMTGCFVEHFQEYNLIWNGDHGRVFFFQNELPYDPPTQDDWVTPEGTLGWAGYKVNDTVTTHEFWGAGVYCYNRNNPGIVTDNGFEVPRNSSGIKAHRLYTRNLSGPGIVNSVINGVGDKVDELNPGPVYLTLYDYESQR